MASAQPDQAQWSALRLTDLEYAGLVELYGLSLGSNDCRIRSVAAKRLAELHSLEAVPALKKLRDSPRKKEDDCGQEAASASVRKRNP